MPRAGGELLESDELPGVRWGDVAAQSDRGSDLWARIGRVQRRERVDALSDRSAAHPVRGHEPPPIRHDDAAGAHEHIPAGRARQRLEDSVGATLAWEEVPEHDDLARVMAPPRRPEMMTGSPAVDGFGLAKLVSRDALAAAGAAPQTTIPNAAMNTSRTSERRIATSQALIRPMYVPAALTGGWARSCSAVARYP